MKGHPLLARVALAFRLARLAMRTAPSRRSAYVGADDNRLLYDWTATAKTLDQIIRGESRKLRARTRELARNNSYCRRYLKLLVTNVLGPLGIKLRAVVKKSDGELDEDVNRKIEAAWRLWARKPVTLDGRANLRQCESLLLRTLAVDGEVFVRLWRGSDVNPFGLALQVIDPDLVDERYNVQRSPGQNEIRLGVEVDAIGRPIGYWIWDNPLGVASITGRARYFVPAADLRHLYVQDRPNQTRGVTWLNSIMIPAHMLDGYEESEAVASRVSSSKMGFLTKINPEIGGSLSTTGDDGKTPATMQAAPGSFEILDDGYDFKPWDPDHPTSQFGAFIMQMVRKIASGLNVFANVLANDATQITYSTMRSFALIERDDWRQIQEDLNDMWREPLFEAWIDTALLSGALRLPTRNPALYLDVKHCPRGWSWIDPQKEASGAVLSIEHGLATRTSILAEKGLDVEEVFRELHREEELAAELGISISKTPTPEAPATKSDLEDVIGDRDNGGAGAPLLTKPEPHIVAGC